MKTYNVKVDDTIVVIEASGCSVSHSGALLFTDASGKVCRAFNVGVWEDAWVVQNV